MQTQGMPMNKRAWACSQPPILLTPGPPKAYHHDCTEYRPIPSEGPVDNPASHWGKVVYAGDCKINHKQYVYIPLSEGRAPPGVCWCMHSMPTNLTRTLLLCGFPLHMALIALWCPKGNRLNY